MPTLTVGVNSYINVADADTYFDNSVKFPTWSALDDDTKSRSLITSSQQISLAVRNDCALPLDPADISTPLADAAAEYALFIVGNEAILTEGNTSSNIKMVKAGTVSVTYFSQTKGSRFPASVQFLLVSSGCLDGANAGVANSGAAKAFGTDVQSTFTDEERYNRSRGFG